MSTSGLQASKSGGVTAEANFRIERWVILLLGSLATGLLGYVVGEYAVDTDPVVMASLAITGFLVGFLLARTAMVDIVAHAIAFLLGIVVSLIAIDPTQLGTQLRAGEWRVATDRYKALLSGFVNSLDSGDRFETDVAVFAIGLTMWLVGYTSAWMLFRRGWVFWSLALPGAILLVTMALDRDRPTWPALLFLGFALAIAAAQTAASRSAYWRSRAIPEPSSYGRRSILLGGLISIFAIAVGLYYSYDLDDQLQERAIQSGDRLASWMSDRFDQSNQEPVGQQAVAGNYGAFSDQFKIGDGIPTGDSPIVVMQASGERYLAARRMSEYDGAGWISSASATDDELKPAPRIAFQADQPMNVPRDQLQYHVQDQASIVLLQPTGRLLFSIDQHYSASVPTLVRVGWQQIDLAYDIDNTELSEVPVDLRELVALLQAADFSEPATSDVPDFLAAEDRVEFERIQNSLLQSYPVDVDLQWGEGGTAQVRLYGRLPVYSDVEAVFASEELIGEAYSVVGLTPQVTADDLRGAGTAYAQFISDTYLGLPADVTDRTRSLANQIVADAGASTAYDQAIAIQNYLRSNFTYQLDAGAAPDGSDTVDYFLFESQVGRCDHYASSMAVMLRSLGVPTRIVTGLAPVPFDDGMNGYVYRGRNAHAWVEVYFPGFGWIPFEPTPTQQAIDLDTAGIDQTATPEPTPTPTPDLASEGTPSPAAQTPTPTPLPAPAASDTSTTGPNDGPFSPRFLGVGAAVAALLAGGLLYALRRRNEFGGLPIASANFGRLQRLGGYFGVRPTPELTPREYASQLGSARPQSAAGALRVADAFTQEQYATNVDPGVIARESEFGWREAKRGASDWRFWRR